MAEIDARTRWLMRAYGNLSDEETSLVEVGRRATISYDEIQAIHNRMCRTWGLHWDGKTQRDWHRAAMRRLLENG